MNLDERIANMMQKSNSGKTCSLLTSATKEKYETKQKAKSIIKVLNTKKSHKSNYSTSPLCAYSCDCGYWHIGHASI